MNRDPLRKVIGREWVQLTESGAGGMKERLECGHLQWPVSDLAGETNAVRRRCWQCAKEQKEKEGKG